MKGVRPDVGNFKMLLWVNERMAFASLTFYIQRNLTGAVCVFTDEE